MNVPARGGVNRTVSESCGAIIGSVVRPAPLQFGTPSGKLSSSIPCQWIAASSCERFTIVTATGSPRTSDSTGPGTGIESAVASAGEPPSTYE